MTWERARQPEQIENRRRAILTAAAEVFEAEGFEGATLSAIARASTVSKASLYRYFESREEIFLHLLLEEQAAWIEAVERSLGKIAGSGDVEGVATRLADAHLSHPRHAALSAVVSSVLEHNVSVDRLRDFKRSFIAAALRLVNAVHAALPDLDVLAARRFLTFHVLFAHGLYPATHPPEAAQLVMQEPEFAQLCVDERALLVDHARVVLTGLQAKAGE